MSGSCKAEGRNRKSNANVAYKAGNRQDVNQKRKMKAHVENSKSIATKEIEGRRAIVVKGTGRKERREAWLGTVRWPDKPQVSFKKFEEQLKRATAAKE